jgi:hypothetical protein
VKTTWIPRLTEKQALAICGSLSNPSKMPGHGYALPAYRCRIGSLLQLIPKAICHYCYALRGRYPFPVVRAAMEKRSGERYFRWHDSGDLQSIDHLRNIVAVCKNLPRVKFWLPTREYQTVEAYRRMGERIPSNLCLRLSAHLIDGKLPLGYGLPVSTVSSREDQTPIGTHHCPAVHQGNNCGQCRAC